MCLFGFIYNILFCYILCTINYYEMHITRIQLFDQFNISIIKIITDFIAI